MSPFDAMFMVYLLIDPRDLLPFYVGMTCHPHQRWNGHNTVRLSRAHSRLSELRRLGMKCRVRIVRLDLSYDEARDLEKQTIETHGEALLNHRPVPVVPKILNMDELLSPADLERLADEAGLSLAELCRRANVAHTTFYRWRLGRTSPSLDVYRRLRDVLRAAQADAA